jgi:hypothetical protein
LVEREVHLAPAFRGALNAVPRVPERHEVFLYRVGHEFVAVREEQHPRLARAVAGGVPPREPQLPADLERNGGLPGPGGECQQAPLLLLAKSGEKCRIDGDALSRRSAGATVSRPLARIGLPAPEADRNVRQKSRNGAN